MAFLTHCIWKSFLILSLGYLCSNAFQTGNYHSPWIQSENGSVEDHKPKYEIILKWQDWWAAADNCRASFAGALAVLKHVNEYQDMDWLRDNIFHWVGALTYPQWIWKGNGQSVYSYLGFGYLSPMYYTIARHQIAGNSALACHQSCGKEYRVFGLQGKRCFCLRYFTNVTRHQLEVKCPGNYYEQCGNDDGISVYRLVDIIFFPQQNSKCAYVGITRTPPYSFETFSYYCEGEHYYPYITVENNCNTGVKRYSACSYPARMSSFTKRWKCAPSVCLEKVNQTYSSVIEVCSLITVTNNNAKELTEFMVQDVIYGNGNLDDTYWIGLERNKESMWIDGTGVDRIVSNSSNDVLPKCLAVRRMGSQTTFFWKDCSTEMSSICQIGTAKDKHSHTSSPLTTQTFPPNDSRTTASSTIGHSESLRTLATKMHVHNKSLFSSQTETPNEDYSNKVGISVGGAVGSIAVLIAVLFLFISYRQRRFCFGTKTPTNSNQDVKFNSSSNISLIAKNKSSLNRPTTTQVDIDNSCEQCAIDNSTASTQPDEMIDYYNMPSENSSQCHSGVSKNDQIYELAGSVEVKDSGYYNVTGPSMKSNSGSYSLANTTYAENSETHSVSHLTGARTHTADVKADMDSLNTGSEYNVLGQHVLKGIQSAANAYDHIGKVLQEGDYDTAGVSGSFHMADDTYDHTGERRDLVDDSYNHTAGRGYHADDNYNTTQRGHGHQARPSDDYCDANALTAHVDKNLYHVPVNEQENEDNECSLYHSIDVTNIHGSDESLYRSNTEYEDVSIIRH